MEVILLQDVEGLGKEGDSIKTKDGYARNYLIPKKLAAFASPAALKALEVKKKKKADGEKKEIERLKVLAEKISQLSITIPVESGVNDVLFGSVTSESISHAIREEGIEIDKKNITVNEPIKKLGIYNAEARLHPEIKATLRIWVVKK